MNWEKAGVEEYGGTPSYSEISSGPGVFSSTAAGDSELGEGSCVSGRAPLPASDPDDSARLNSRPWTAPAPLSDVVDVEHSEVTPSRLHVDREPARLLHTTAPTSAVRAAWVTLASAHPEVRALVDERERSGTIVRGAGRRPLGLTGMPWGPPLPADGRGVNQRGPKTLPNRGESA